MAVSGESDKARGVIDEIEGAWARLALDDGQRLNWPVERLPAEAARGMAVVLSLEAAPAPGAQAEAGTWAGMLRDAEDRAAGKGLWARVRRALRTVPEKSLPEAQAEAGLLVELGTQCLAWPGAGEHATGDPVLLRMHIDAADTEQRRQHVQDLVDDLFG